MGRPATEFKRGSCSSRGSSSPDRSHESGENCLTMPAVICKPPGSPPVNRLLGARQWRFLVTGLSAVVADYGTFNLSRDLFQAGLGVATVASFLAGFVISFGLNKLWVFESR